MLLARRRTAVGPGRTARWRPAGGRAQRLAGGGGRRVAVPRRAPGLLLPQRARGHAFRVCRRWSGIGRVRSAAGPHAQSRKRSAQHRSGVAGATVRPFRGRTVRAHPAGAANRGTSRAVLARHPSTRRGLSPVLIPNLGERLGCLRRRKGTLLTLPACKGALPNTRRGWGGAVSGGWAAGSGGARTLGGGRGR